jgi:predicted CopG family antitoxin
MQAATTIYIREDLKEQLASLKRHSKESYNDVIERLLNLAVDDEPLGEDTLQGIEESLKDIRLKRVVSEKEIMEKYGVE